MERGVSAEKPRGTAIGGKGGRTTVPLKLPRSLRGYPGGLSKISASHNRRRLPESCRMQLPRCGKKRQNDIPLSAASPDQVFTFDGVVNVREARQKLYPERSGPTVAADRCARFNRKTHLLRHEHCLAVPKLSVQAARSKEQS
jgi:hypothetical protein